MQASAVRLRCGLNDDNYTQLVIQNDWVVIKRIKDGTKTILKNLLA